MTEIDALTKIDKLLETVTDSAARDRILNWIWDKHASSPSPQQKVGESGGKRKKKQGKKKQRKKKGTQRRSTLSIVKGLDLKPKGKTSFADFVKEKNPSSNQDKCVVSVYYLRHELGNKAINANDVFTCFKAANWRVPADLENTLAVSATRKGWFDTSDRQNIKITIHGENFVEHDLPSKPKGSK